MNEAEYWILETALEGWIPLPCLVDPAIETLFNKPAHGLARRDLVALLERLVYAGDIVARSETRGEFSPTRPEIQAELRYRPRVERANSLSYGLTPQGGARWETAVQADWSRYISDWRMITDQVFEGELVESVEIMSQDLGRLRAYVSLLRKGMDRILPASETWDVVAPWNATYWKTLPVGHRVRFHSVDLRGPLPTESTLWTLLGEVVKWYTAPSHQTGKG